MIRATILIPAYNESAVIGRTLLHLSRGLPLSRWRIVVIANGCSDATAAKARSVLPRAIVLETDKPGKCGALNLGYQSAAPERPVIFLDADLDVTSEALNALLAPIECGRAQATCGQMDVHAAEASPLVRTYYKGWRMNPYFDQGKFGGLFALSAKAARSVFPLPDIIADDEFIRRSLPPEQIKFVPDARFIARAPLTLSSLFRVRRRALSGARALKGYGLPSPEKHSPLKVLFRAIRRPSHLVPALVYAAVNTLLRCASPQKTSPPIWDQDLTSRIAR